MTAAVPSKENRMLKDVLGGLGGQPKTLSPKYLYDKEGSELFEKICTLDEYYPTRTEISILETHIADIGAALGNRPILYEFGSGSSVKTQILLSSLPNITGYVPIDICAEALQEAAEELQHRFPKLPISPLCVDFTEGMTLADPITLAHPNAPRVAFVPGSTIGNFTPDEAMCFLSSMATTLGPGSKLLIGVDRIKDSFVLERAYNDSQGVTRDFNLNLLHRLNRELGANFDVSRFRHHAFFNQVHSRIEMHLVCTQSCEVKIQNRLFTFNSGEGIHTENSYKYDPDTFASLAKAAGYHFLKRWNDPKEYFSVFLFGL